MTNVMNADDRREAWNEALYSSETDKWDYGQWLLDIITVNFEAIEEIFGVDQARDALLSLVLEAAQGEGEAPTEWREAIEFIGINALVSWPISETFRALGLYGRYGVTDDSIALEERKAHIDTLLTAAEQFIYKHDLERVAGKQNPLEKIAGLARSRWNLDHLEGEVDPLSLSILGGLSEGRIRNMMSGANREFENTGGKITAASALAWLQSRPDFFHSIWNVLEDDPSPINTQLIGDVVFLPGGADGSIFNPSLNRSAGFTIGAKGHEEVVSTFDEALEKLQKMGSEARWRRPNASGNWSIVKVDRWIPLDRSTLVNL